MHIRILAVGQRQPAWVTSAVDEYALRLPRNWGFSVKEIPAANRGRHRPATAIDIEGEAIIAALAENERLIALDERGKEASSATLCRWLGEWQSDGRDVALAIGGADGLSSACLSRADFRLSLSRFTLPHGLARVLLVEQLYRAWSLQTGHPYHRP